MRTVHFADPCPAAGDDESDACARHSIIVGALLFLMSEHHARPRSDIAFRIVEHLRMLARHPDSTDSMKVVSARLHDRWTRIALDERCGSCPVPVTVH